LTGSTGVVLLVPPRRRLVAHELDQALAFFVDLVSLRLRKPP
jgi:hypothetical protein